MAVNGLDLRRITPLGNRDTVRVMIVTVDSRVPSAC